MLRSTIIRVVSSLARPAMIRRGAARVVAVAAISTAAVATTGTTTTTGAGSVAATNTRSRGVAHVSSVATAAPKHWSADSEGITAQQRELAKVQSTDPIERLAAATTRELLQSACQAPGVIQAVLTNEQVAKEPSAVPVVEERAFLAKMEAEFGADVLQVLRRQQWSVNVVGTKSAKDQVATVVCYFQEGTQRILYRRVETA